MKSVFILLLLLPYGWAAFLTFLMLGMGAGDNPTQAFANVIFAIVWMAIPYVLARAAKKKTNDPNVFNATWVILAWLFIFLMIPVSEALYFIGIDL